MPRLARARAVVELGAGTGILSMHLAANLGTRCIVTDLPHVIPVLKQTMALPANAAAFAACGGPAPMPAAFTWGELPETLLRGMSPHPSHDEAAAGHAAVPVSVPVQLSSPRASACGASSACSAASKPSLPAAASRHSAAFACDRPGPSSSSTSPHPLAAPLCIVGTDCVFSQYMAAPLVRSIAQLAFVSELAAAVDAGRGKGRGRLSSSGKSHALGRRHTSACECGADDDGASAAAGGDGGLVSCSAPRASDEATGVVGGCGSDAPKPTSAPAEARKAASSARLCDRHSSQHLPHACHVYLLNQLRETATQREFEAAASRWFRVQRNGLARWLPDVDPRRSDFRLYRMRLKAGLCAADVGLGQDSLLACGIKMSDPSLFCGVCIKAAGQGDADAAAGASKAASAVGSKSERAAEPSESSKAREQDWSSAAGTAAANGMMADSCVASAADGPPPASSSLRFCFCCGLGDRSGAHARAVSHTHTATGTGHNHHHDGATRVIEGAVDSHHDDEHRSTIDGVTGSRRAAEPSAAASSSRSVTDGAAPLSSSRLQRGRASSARMTANPMLLRLAGLAVAADAETA